MKKIGFLFIGLVMVSVQSHAFLVCKKGDQATVSQAAEILMITKDLYQTGVIRKYEMLRSNIFLFEAKLCSELISQADFCHDALPMLKEIQSVSSMASPRERIEITSLMAEAKLLCGLNSN